MRLIIFFSRVILGPTSFMCKCTAFVSPFLPESNRSSSLYVDFRIISSLEKHRLITLISCVVFWCTYEKGYVLQLNKIILCVCVSVCVWVTQPVFQVTRGLQNSFLLLPFARHPFIYLVEVFEVKIDEQEWNRHTNKTNVFLIAEFFLYFMRLNLL